MGTLTFTELQDEVRSALGGRTDQDARLPRAINIAQQRLARIHDFDEMETLSTVSFVNTGSDNDRFITLPSVREVYSIIRLDGAQSEKLKQRSTRYFDTLIPKPEYWTRDKPLEYVLWAGKAEIWPMASVTYTGRVRWSKWPTDLSAAGSTSEFLQKDDILVELATIYILNSLGKEEDAAKHTRTLNALLVEAVNIDSTKPDLDITPRAGISVRSSEPWNDPFIRATS